MYRLSCFFFSFSEKTEVFLEVFGNSEIRSQTEETLRHGALQLSLSVTETLETATHHCLNTILLKVLQTSISLHVFVRHYKMSDSEIKH